MVEVRAIFVSDVHLGSRACQPECGDWVDRCAAIVEHLDARMELVRRCATPIAGGGAAAAVEAAAA